MHLQWNRCHIFTNKRGTYGIIADDLRFTTQLSNVYGNAIRAKLAAAQTTRSVAGSFSSFVTQNLQSICDYTIGIHAFFINLRNSIPLQMHESPPFATPDAKSCFCFPSLWQSKRKKPNFFAKNDSGKTLAEVTEKTLQDQRGRKENLERITREYGTQLRMNRSIQAGLLSKTEGLDKCSFSAVQVL